MLIRTFWLLLGMHRQACCRWHHHRLQTPQNSTHHLQTQQTISVLHWQHQSLFDALKARSLCNVWKDGATRTAATGWLQGR
jgi:hypothetical protein